MIEALNLLAGHTCENCKRQKHDDMCIRFLGESIGWQWWERNKSGTCEDWIGETEWTKTIR